MYSEDMVTKARMPRGEKHHLSKLSDAEIVQIRALYESGAASQREIAEKYGVSTSLIGLIVRNKHRRSA